MSAAANAQVREKMCIEEKRERRKESEEPFLHRIKAFLCLEFSCRKLNII